MTQAPAEDDAKPLPEPDVGLDSPEAVVEEELALSIDPYPRAPDAELPADAINPDDSDSPFAALSALKRGR